MASAEAEYRFLAANPELLTARAWMGSAELESSFLAANPELILSRFYGRGLVAGQVFAEQGGR
jgi:hypothetical protein